MSWHDSHQYKAPNQQNKHISIVGKRPRLVHKHKQIDTRTLFSVNVNQYYILCVCMCVWVFVIVHCRTYHSSGDQGPLPDIGDANVSVHITSVHHDCCTGFVYTHLIFYGHIRTIRARKNPGDVFDDLEPLNM